MNELGGEIGKVCERLGLIAIRVQTGTIPVRGRYIHCAPKGTPDWITLGPHGQCVFLESKMPDKDLSDEQKAWRARAARLGHVVVRVVNESDVVKACRENLDL